MNKILKGMVVLFIAICTVAGCKKMDTIYKGHVVPGGLTYAGKATDPKVYSGHNRLKIAWPRGADPTVVKAKIYWNNFADSLAIPILPTDDTVSVIIDSLLEKSYSFIIYTYDAKGNSSIPVDVIGGSFGDKYQAQLLNRPVNSSILNALGLVTIQWGSADISNGAFATEVKYIDTAGNSKTVNFSTTEKLSTLSDLKPNTKFQFRTMFKPDSMSIDNFYTAYSESGAFNFDKKDWKIIDYSSQHSDGDNAVINFIDGTDATRWHTDANNSHYPHFATIDMGAVRVISQFGLWRTTFETGGDDRAPDQIQFLISMDNVTWEDLGVFPFNRFLNGEQSYPMPSLPKGRYFKFVGVSGPREYMVMGEVSAYGF